jgi:hypothetical protein
MRSLPILCLWYPITFVRMGVYSRFVRTLSRLCSEVSLQKDTIIYLQKSFRSGLYSSEVLTKQKDIR